MKRAGAVARLCRHGAVATHPLQDVSALEKVDHVMKGGAVVR